MIHTDGRPTIANYGVEPPKADLPEDPETPDFVIEREGSIFLVAAVTSRADEWLNGNVDPEAQYFGKRLVVDQHYIADLVLGMADAGFTVI